MRWAQKQKKDFLLDSKCSELGSGVGAGVSNSIGTGIGTGVDNARLWHRHRLSGGMFIPTPAITLSPSKPDWKWEAQLDDRH